MMPDFLALRLAFVLALICMVPCWFGVFSLLHALELLLLGAVDFGVQRGLQTFRRP